jgi:hypothetical protein
MSTNQVNPLAEKHINVLSDAFQKAMEDGEKAIMQAAASINTSLPNAKPILEVLGDNSKVKETTRNHPEKMETFGNQSTYSEIADEGAVGILHEAANIVGGNRQQTHGDKERSFQIIADFWNHFIFGRKEVKVIYFNLEDSDKPEAYYKFPVLEPRHVAQMMELLKIARSIQGTPHRDHFVDAAGYAALAGELVLGEEK